MHGTTSELRPITILDDSKLTTEERLALREAGFDVSPRCAYCGDVVWEPHYGCDARLALETKVHAAIRESVQR